MRGCLLSRPSALATNMSSAWQHLASSVAASQRLVPTTRTPQRRPGSSLCCHAVLDVPSPAQPSTLEPVLPRWSGSRKYASSHRRPEPSAQELEALAAIEEVVGPLSTRPMAPPARPIVVIISGPSGVGKDSVVERLKDKRDDIHLVVTATSRPKRPNEVEGKDYFFVTKERFEHWIAAGELLEHAVVYGEYKGIPRQQVDQALGAGTDVILRIDVQGAATMKRLMPHAVSVFIAAESERELVQRLVARKTESLERLAVRVGTARQELARAAEFDYVVVNRDGGLEECADQISAIIEAEKHRVGGQAPPQGAEQQQQQQQQQQQV